MQCSKCKMELEANSVVCPKCKNIFLNKDFILSQDKVTPLTSKHFETDNLDVIEILKKNLSLEQQDNQTEKPKPSETVDDMMKSFRSSKSPTEESPSKKNKEQNSHSKPKNTKLPRFRDEVDYSLEKTAATAENGSKDPQSDKSSERFTDKISRNLKKWLKN